MKTLFSWLLAMLLTLSHALPVGAQLPPRPGVLDQSCKQELAEVAPKAHGRHATVATVLQVDHQSGLLKLQIDIGWVVTFVAPEKIQHLQAGDQILVCMAETDAVEDLPQETPDN